MVAKVLSHHLCFPCSSKSLCVFLYLLHVYTPSAFCCSAVLWSCPYIPQAAGHSQRAISFRLRRHPLSACPPRPCPSVSPVMALLLSLCASLDKRAPMPIVGTALLALRNKTIRVPGVLLSHAIHSIYSRRLRRLAWCWIRLSVSENLFFTSLQFVCTCYSLVSFAYDLWHFHVFISCSPLPIHCPPPPSPLESTSQTTSHLRPRSRLSCSSSLHCMDLVQYQHLTASCIHV